MPSQAWLPDRPDILDLLHTRVQDAALLAAGSNVYLYPTDAPGGRRSYAVYKPQREAPLSDFPDGTLYRREYAAYLVSEAMGGAWCHLRLCGARASTAGSACCSYLSSTTRRSITSR